MKRIRDMIGSAFAKSVFMIAGGTAIAQAVNAASAPVITRLYSPEEYGILTVYSAILSLVAIVGSLKYEYAIPIADDDEKAVNVIALGLVVLLAVAGVITVALLLFGRPLLALFDGATLLKYRLLIPLGVVLAGIYSIAAQWAFRRRDFRAISLTKLTQAIAQNVTKIGLGLLKLGPIGLITGGILGQSAGVGTLSRSLLRQDRKLLKKVSVKEIVWCARRYMRFPVFLAPSQLLNTAGVQLPVLLVTALYGGQVIGFYGLANAVLSLPMTVIGKAISDVFYGEAAGGGKANPARIKHLSHRLVVQLSLIGLVPLAVVLIFGPALFSFVFGPAWQEAGTYARILSFLVYARLIFTPASRVYAVFEKQKEAFFLDLAKVILLLAVFGVSKAAALSSYWAVGLYAGTMSIVYLATYLLARHIIHVQVQKQGHSADLAARREDEQAGGS